MSQLFEKSADTYFRLGILGAFLLLLILWAVSTYACQPGYIKRNGWTSPQPVPFSHKHHVGGLGLDCRYCHTSVTNSANAGFPPTHTCMTCHSQVWTHAPVLEPVRQSYRLNRPLHWKRIYNLPDFVMFRHDVHVANGVGCEDCHGRIDKQPLTRQAVSLQMHWCLDCHRHPEEYLRPRSEVFTMGWKPPDNREALGRKLVKKYGIDEEILTDCSTCHY